MVRILAYALTAWTLVFATPGLAAQAKCAAETVAHPAPDAVPSALALAQLADIGSPDSSDLAQASPLAISPDGSKVAFILRRGDPIANKICSALLVLDIAAGGPPRILDRGGELILATGDYRRLVVVTGTPQTVTPLWSPDGASIAYLRRDRGRTQLWLADAVHGRARKLTDASGDVTRAAWTDDGRALIYAVREGDAQHAAAVAEEALIGWHYDDRMTPNRGTSPQLPAGLPDTVHAFDRATGVSRSATPMETVTLDPDGILAPRSRVGLKSPDGLPLTFPVLWGIARDGTARTCNAEACRGRIPWFVEGLDNSILFLRREGWARDALTLYRWHPRHSAPPKRMWSTKRTLLGCRLAHENLICLEESVRSPRRIVSVDLETGTSRVLYDPNRQFRDLALGSTVALRWKNELGLEARGDLVLPSGPRPDAGWPLIVVQYNSQGFLRGGTGDEVPIFALAARGFAVLSVEQPTIVATRAQGLRTFDEVNAYNTHGWAERKSLLSSLLVGVALVVARGDADPSKVGITGLSDGATSVAFALINSRAFAAASISTCCIEPWSVMAMGGPAWAASMRKQGHPPATSSDTDFWRPMSLALNAERIDTPLLMHLADDEYLLALQTYAALREHDQPVDMFVFPNEHHVKWQPRHRLAVYERNIDWFAFWLRGEEDPNPSKAIQYRHWRAFKLQPRL